MDAQPPTYVVSHLTASDAGNNYPYAYTYAGGKVHLLGRGWLGFRVMEVLDTSAGVRNTTFFNQGLEGGIAQFNQNFPKVGMPNITETEDAGGNLILEVDRTYSVVVPDPYPGVKRLQLTQQDRYEAEGLPLGAARHTRKLFEYDAHGNLTRNLHEGVVGVAGDERDERTDWAVDVANWLHRPKTSTLYDGSLNKLREKWLFYDGNNSSHGVLGSAGLLTKEESRRNLDSGLGSPDNPVFLYAYDSFGNRTSVTDPRSCGTTTAYESTHRTFPATVVRCASTLNFVTTYVYDPAHGVKASETDPNGQTTAYQYDAFGRLTKVTGPLDTGSTHGTVAYEYPDWGAANQRVVTRKTEQHGTSNVHVTEDYFDGFGRVDFTSSEGPAGSPIVTQTVYDSRGLVISKSVPRFSSETIQWIQFTHDALGRQTQVTHPDNRIATKVYAPGKVTVTDERGKIKIQFMNAYGLLDKVHEKNGSETYETSYTYDAAGSLVTVSNHLNHVTAMTYDLLGRKIAMQDPNMGNWSYSYTTAGDLDTQTDAKNQTLTFTYDELGRSKTKKHDTTTLVTWTYDDAAVAFSKGRLTKVVDTSVETRFAYDAIGRTTQIQRIIDGVIYTMSQSYDALNRIETETFPDAEAVTYNYNPAGWLSSVPGYINTISYNARGQKTGLQYANGLNTVWSYYTQNFRVERRQTTFSGTHALNALTRWAKSWITNDPIVPTGYSNLYRGGVCVADGSGNCLGGDSMLESGIGSLLGYVKNSGGAGTLPVYQSTCYSDSSGACAAWGLSLDVNGTPVGYLSTTAPGQRKRSQAICSK